MMTAVYSRRIACKEDMSELEQVMTRINGGQRCSFMRSSDYIRFRLAALYGTFDLPVEAYGETLKVTLDGDRNATVYILGHVVTEETELGKRQAPDSDESEPDDPGRQD
jgi:hypothetical protein